MTLFNGLLTIPTPFKNITIRGRDFLLGLSVGFALSLSSTGIAFYFAQRWRKRITRRMEKRPIEIRSDEVVDGVPGLIGNTPLVRIKSLSDLTGIEILGKAEFLNPGGSVKDRVALQLIDSAEQSGLLRPNTNPPSCIFEGTSGSTGISIATVAKARGYDAVIVLPDDTAAEKSMVLEKLGATVQKVRPVSIVDKNHYVNLARRRALEFGKTKLVGPSGSSSDSSPSMSPTPPDVPSTSGYSLSSSSFFSSPSGSFDESLMTESESKKREDLVVTVGESGEGSGSDPLDFLERKPRGFFADQFENLANYEAHLRGTGPEIWRQTNGCIDAFVSGAGTGGTIAGSGTYLKSMNNDIKVVLSDPEGSGLFHKVKHGVMYNEREAEGTRRRYQVDTVVEGIGINRITRNFEQGLPIIDDAIRVTDAEAVAMSRHLVEADGLFLGSSSAVNLVACVKLARKMKDWSLSGKTIVTILCDSGNRHYSKFWNDDYLRAAGIPVSSDISSILHD